MRALDTIRGRIILGLSGLLLGLIVAAVVGITGLGTLRRTLGAELEHLATSSAAGSGVVTAVFDEIRAAELYLDAPSRIAAEQFRGTVDVAFRYLKQLEGLDGLTQNDRLTINRIKQLQATIHVEYALAHALLDLGRARAAEE
ncbi:MAG: hypothetical protein ACREMN_06370, partial [Gemmatimonadales bacterium]